MELIKDGEDMIIDGFNCARDKQAPRITQDGHILSMLQEMFNLNGDIIGQAWKLLVEGLDDA